MVRKMFLALVVLLTFTSSALAQSDYEIVNPTWANPFDIDLSGMTNFSLIPEDDPSDGINWTKVDLPAPCVNGAGNSTFIMVRKGYGEDQNKLLIYLEGGGACMNWLTCGPTPYRSVTTLEPNFTTLSFTYRHGIFNITDLRNPFRNWTMVFVPYGTGDIHMGNRVVKYYNLSNPAQNITVYHVGYVNAIVAMRWINNSSTFSNVVVSGSSAGGFGTILHFYRASEIFKKGVIAIDDAGPGTKSKSPAFGMDVVSQRWGSNQSFPEDSLNYFADGSLLRFTKYALERCSECIFGLFEDQYDDTIGVRFQGYSHKEFRGVLLSLTNEIKSEFGNRFFRYLPLDSKHVVLPYTRFYSLNISGDHVYAWINDLLSGNGRDVIQQPEPLPIIFVHGMAGSGAQFETQAMRFTSNRYPANYIMVFEYNSTAYATNTTIAALYRAQLAQMVNETFNNTGKKVVLVGHSMGTTFIFYYALTYRDYVDKVAKVILIDGISNASIPTITALSVPTMTVYGRPTSMRPPGAHIPYATNVYIQNQTHVEVCTSPETFRAIYEFIMEANPETTKINPEENPVLKGKLVYFPSNIGLETGTLNIYKLHENGFRVSNTPVASFTITNGEWGPFTAEKGVRYEFEFVRTDNLTMHIYREPFIRSDQWIRILVSPPGGIADYASRSDNHTNLLIMRYKEVLTEVDPLYVKSADDLRINGVAVCDPRICNVSKSLNGPTGIWIFDNKSDGVSVLYPPDPFYHAQGFQTGIDYFIPAGTPNQSIVVTIFDRSGGVQSIAVPNWRSSEHRVVLQFNDYLQPNMISPDAEILIPYYIDPFAVNVSGMANFTDIQVDDPSDGINWTKVDLPSDCKSGFGNPTFIMVRKGSENKVLIYLEGGGACSSFGSCDPTEVGGRGTVTSLDPKFGEGPRPLNRTYVRGIFDVKNTLNPFRNWTMVFVPYSTGDIFMGNRVVKYYNLSNPAQNKTIYHIGYVNAIVAMRWINASGTFEPVVVTGTSAGGFGTILHFYRASQIFNKGIIAINDAGPGTMPNITSTLPPAVTAEKWGSMQNYPPESLPYFADTDTIRFLNWALNASLGGCGDCIYALFQDQWDFIIGPYFQGYSFPDFQARLLSVIGSIKANFSTRFCSYLPLSTYHTAFAGGYNYPVGDRFYALHIDGYYLRQWINDVLSRNCTDRRDLGLRDLRVEILSAPSSAVVGIPTNITVRVSNIGSNATPDPFFVIFSNRTATLGSTVLTLSANASVTVNFTWTPATAGTEMLNVTVDGLPVPALRTLLPLGSVVELNETNNIASVTVGVCRVNPVPSITITNWLTPYEVAISMLPPIVNVTIPDGTNVSVNLTWLSIVDPVFPSFNYSPVAAAATPPYRAIGRMVNPPAVCPAELATMNITTNLTLQTPLLPGLYPTARIYPDGRALNITDKTLFNQPGTYANVTISFGGLDRTYSYYVPTSYDPRKPTPLVFVFHGGGSCGLAQMLAVDDFAELYGFILVTPDAYGWSWNRTRDVPFVSKIIDEMKARFNIDERRIYATGISMGGMMTTWVIYDPELGKRIAAAGVVSGSRELLWALQNGSTPVRPMTIVITAGTDERIMGAPIFEHLNARNATNLLVQVWKCSPTPETKFWPPTLADPNTNVTRYVYSGCVNGVKVVYFEVGSGGHAWMGGLQYVIPGSIGWVTKHIDAWNATDGLWAYLKEEVLPVPPPPPPPPPPLMGGGGGGGAMPGVPVYLSAYETVRANEESIIELPQSAFWETNVLALIILSSEDGNVRFRVEKLKELPPNIPTPSGVLVAIWSIEPRLSKEAEIKGKIKFGIEIDAIKEKGFDPNAVALILLKWDGKQWIELPTKFLSSDGKYNYYEATTPSFSYFVAIIKPAVTPTPKPTTPLVTPTPTTPTTPELTPTPTPKPFIP
ncbi:MAG: pectin acetylesterase-family hydrolase, partial [Archaeoglobaceae archaeon]|nr:pectin acetylesterase-family hydrolase [Archaeoglobaceae archaeon]MDW8118735.1 pectin acetylesterase-family hydrolase [Archaeoglobaceae archaeon]